MLDPGLKGLAIFGVGHCERSGMGFPARLGPSATSAPARPGCTCGSARSSQGERVEADLVAEARTRGGEPAGRDELETWADRVLDAERLEDVFGSDGGA